MANTMKIAVLLTAMDKMSAVVDRAVTKAEKRIKSLQKTAKHIGEASEKMMIGGAAGTAFFGLALEAAEDSEVAARRLRQVFKSMHQDYKTATKQSEEYASKLQVQIGQEDELIMAVQAKLATFENAANAQARANGIFNRATRAAFDMQAAGFGEAAQNSVQLGKALQDPIKGIKSLARSGITFTATEQAKIKALVESGKLFKAQNMVMKAIEKQVGGVAAATATKTAKMKAAWHEVMEKIGGTVLPLWDKLATKLARDVIPKIQAFIEKHPNLVKWVGIASVALLGLGIAGKALSFIMGGLGPIIKIVSFAFKFFGNVVKAVEFIVNIGGGPILWIIAAIAVAAFLIIKYWKPIKAFFINIWAGIKSVFFKVVGWLKSFWNGVTSLFKLNVKIITTVLNPFSMGKLIVRHWSGIKAFFSGLWNGVKSIFSGFVKWVGGLGTMFYNAGANIMKSIWRGIKAFVMAPVNAVKGMVKKIRNLLPFSPAKEGPLKDIHKIKLVETIAASINSAPMVKAMRGVVSDTAAVGSRASILPRAGGGANITLHYAPTITGGAGSADLATELRKHSKEMMQMVSEEMRKRDRTKF